MAFQACHEQNIITSEELHVLIKILNTRNLAAHVYDEEIAARASKEIAQYSAVMHTVVLKLKAK